MNLLDVFGDGRYRVNLDLVRLVKVNVEDRRTPRREITFRYKDGEEDVFGVPSGRLAVLSDLFDDLKIIAA